MMLFEPKITKRAHDEIVAGLAADVRAAEQAYNDMRSKWQAEMTQKVKAMLLAGERAREIRTLRAELAKTYVRNERGQIVRHPTFLPLPAGDMGEMARG